MGQILTPKRKEILDFISLQIKSQGYPPSVREIGDAVGLSSTSTVHAHLNILQKEGFLFRDPTKPRAIGIRVDETDELPTKQYSIVEIPLVGNVAAGTGVLAEENVDEIYRLPRDLVGGGVLFMLKVRGDSMINSGIFPEDFIIVRQDSQPNNGDIVVAGIANDEATVKILKRTRDKIILVPSNPEYCEIILNPDEVTIYGKVVSVFRQL